MNVRNCRKCGRLFNYALGPIMCPQCKEAMDAKFKEVKEYIQKHPGCGMNDVARECDVVNPAGVDFAKASRTCVVTPFKDVISGVDIKFSESPVILA